MKKRARRRVTTKGTKGTKGRQVDGSSLRLTANSCWLNQMFGCAGGNVGWGGTGGRGEAQSMRANRVCPTLSALGELLFKPDETGTR